MIDAYDHGVLVGAIGAAIVLLPLLLICAAGWIGRTRYDARRHALQQRAEYRARQQRAATAEGRARQRIGVIR